MNPRCAGRWTRDEIEGVGAESRKVIAECYDGARREHDVHVDDVDDRTTVARRQLDGFERRGALRDEEIDRAVVDPCRRDRRGQEALERRALDIDREQESEAQRSRQRRLQHRVRGLLDTIDDHADRRTRNAARRCGGGHRHVGHACGRRRTRCRHGRR